MSKQDEVFDFPNGEEAKKMMLEISTKPAFLPNVCYNQCFLRIFKLK